MVNKRWEMAYNDIHTNINTLWLPYLFSYYSYILRVALWKICLLLPYIKYEYTMAVKLFVITIYIYGLFKYIAIAAYCLTRLRNQ